MTRYLKELLKQVDDKFGKLSSGKLTEKLYEIGVIDPTLCKVLAVREYVHKMIRQGDKKIDAMWKASDKFCCTYEYIRKCIYYYTDINFD